MNQVNVYLFGYPSIERNGQPVEVDTRKAVALLAYLTLSREAQSRDILAALLWPDYDQVSARGALRRTLSVLNKATGADVLSIDRERVQVRSGAGLWCDVAEFENLLAQAASMQTAGSQLQILGEALRLAKDRFMAGFSLRDSSEFDDWQGLQSERLSRQQGLALQKLASGLADRGEYEAAISAAIQWLALDPLIEEAHRLLIRLYALSGQRGAALRQYRDCVRVLDQELGVLPLAETTDLYQAVLEDRLNTEIGHVTARSHQISDAQALSLPYAALSPLIGRESDLRDLWRAYAQARAGLQFVLLEGEAGIGKTRLAEEHATRVGSSGGKIITLRCYQGETHLSYAPFVTGITAVIEQPALAAGLKDLSPQVLADAARLLPEITRQYPNLPALPTAEGAAALTRLFDSIHRLILSILAGPEPGLILLDDLQWADAASIELIAYLLRRLQERPVQVVATLRADELSGQEQVTALLHEARRAGFLARIPLRRLNETELLNLAQSFNTSAAVLPPDFSARLFQETEGLPMFAVEFIQQALQKGSAGENIWDIPAGVRDLILSRMQRLDEAARQLVGAAAVIGRSFDLPALRDISGRSEMETITGLEALTAHGLVLERASPAGEIRFDFTHDKLRAIAYDETSLARRRLLHRRAAEALLSVNSRVPADAGMIALHYDSAGLETLAAGFYRQAGDHARSLYAATDAMAHYRAALACGYPGQAELHEAIGDLHTLKGEYAAASASYETAASLCPPESLAGLEHKLGNLNARMGEWDRTESHYQAALDSGANSPSVHAAILADWSQAVFNRGQIERATELAVQALRQATMTGDLLVEAQALNKLGIYARAEGQFDQALAHLEQALRLSEQINQPDLRIAALNNLAGVYADLAQYEHAIRLNLEALDLCARIGDRHRQAALLNHLADLHHAAGDNAASMRYLHQAVAIFAEVGGENGGLKPDIWNLTEW